MSAKKRVFHRLYQIAKVEAIADQVKSNGFTYCTKCLVPTSLIEPHHTQSRIGENLLVFKLVCSICHRAIHSNPKLARLEGWLK